MSKKRSKNGSEYFFKAFNIYPSWGPISKKMWPWFRKTKHICGCYDFFHAVAANHYPYPGVWHIRPGKLEPWNRSLHLGQIRPRAGPLWPPPHRLNRVIALLGNLEASNLTMFISYLLKKYMRKMGSYK